jgi:hypothetical protein
MKRFFVIKLIGKRFFFLWIDMLKWNQIDRNLWKKKRKKKLMNLLVV